MCMLPRMRWTPGGTSSDIEDRRGQGGGGGFGFGGGGFGGLHLGIGGTLLLLILSFVFRINLLSVFSGGGGQPVRPAVEERDREAPGGQSREVQFVSFVLDD